MSRKTSLVWSWAWEWPLSIKRWLPSFSYLSPSLEQYLQHFCLKEQWLYRGLPEQLVYRISSARYLRTTSHRESNMGYWGSNLDWPCTRQTPYLLSYHFRPPRSQPCYKGAVCTQACWGSYPWSVDILVLLPCSPDVLTHILARCFSTGCGICVCSVWLLARISHTSVIALEHARLYSREQSCRDHSQYIWGHQGWNS